MYEDLLGHDRPTEAERLTMMARAHDPDSRESIERLHLPPDATCLDLGAGYGTMAIWMAERFPDGEVFAYDLDDAGFAAHDLPNLRCEAVDVSTADLGEARFDLVHSRATMGFLANRNEVLRRIMTALKPGGSIALCDMDFGPVASGPDPTWARFWSAHLDFARSRDWDFEFGGRAPRLLAELGFEAIVARHIAPILNVASDTPGGAEARTWLLTIERLAPAYMKGGFMTDESVREALALINRPGAWIHGPGFMVVTARRPA